MHFQKSHRTEASGLLSNWLTLREFSGGLGDLGTLIPLSVAVSVVTGRDIGLILLFAGLANIASGFLFRLPVAIQPMKSIAAVAIAGGLTANEMSAAGILVGAAVTIIALCGWADVLGRVIPKPVVRGIQLGIGCKLSIMGIRYVAEQPLWTLDGVLVAVALAGVVYRLRQNKTIPVALLLFGVGVSLAWFTSGGFGPVSARWVHPTLVIGNVESWLTAATEGALAQLPLTLLNSVIAVCALSADLFPDRTITHRRMALSVGVINLIACPFGAMPMCHGSGGLAANYRFGARTGGAVMMLGALLTVSGLFIGSAAMKMLSIFPLAVLGVMLVFSGLELMRPARDLKTTKDVAIMVTTAAGIIAINTFVGFIVGVIAALAAYCWTPRRPNTKSL